MKRLITLILVVILSGIGFAIWWNRGIRPVDRDDHSTKIFVIGKGAGIRKIGNRLKQEGLIRDPTVFFLYVKKEGLDKKIQAGDFRLSPFMDLAVLVSNLTHGTLDIWITIPEGLRAEEIAEILKKNFPKYSDSWRDKLVKSEGYLFPDSYLIPKDADIDSIISILLDNFEKKFKGLLPSQNSLSKQEIVTIASLVEREAKFVQDHPLVASVIINRLNLGMKLDLDATIQYALGYQEDEKRWWKEGLTEEDKNIDSPYNTYRKGGLPPTSISNPGLSVLRAVVNPADTNFLYYISDRSGRNHYAETVGEHNKNIKRYLSP